MDDLKRCPLCGGNAMVETKYSEKNNSYYSTVTCVACRTRTHSIRTADIPNEKQLHGIVMRWNTRVPV